MGGHLFLFAHHKPGLMLAGAICNVPISHVGVIFCPIPSCHIFITLPHPSSANIRAPTPYHGGITTGVSDSVRVGQPLFRQIPSILGIHWLRRILKYVT